MTTMKAFKALLAILLVASVHLAWANAGPETNPDDVVETNYDSREKFQKEALKRPERLTVLAPASIRPQSDYHVLISLANSQVPAAVDVQLIGARDSNREKTESRSVLVSSGETQTLKFTIGDWPSAEYVLTVNALAVDASWNFTKEAYIEHKPKSHSVFIQTDKAIYKPGQLVQFRALFLNQNLQPISLSGQINVTVSDPRRNIIKQWNALSSYRGLLSLDLQLSEDPMLGDYNIKVESGSQETSKQFRVAEYILPTYEVSIQLPSYATYNNSDIVATVKARYTYGKPVNGHVTLTVQPLVRLFNIDTRPLQQMQYRARLVDGAADINVDVVKDLKQERDAFEREIEFFALVEEDLTGRKYNSTAIMKIHDKPIKVELIDNENSSQQGTFRPGLSQLLQLKVAYQDDIPVEENGPQLDLRYSIGGRVVESTKHRPVGGIVEHTIQVPREVPSNVLPDTYVTPNFIEIQATYRGQNYRVGSLTPFVTESGHHLQVVLPQIQSRQRQRGKPSVNVNDDLKVKVRATEPMQQVNCQGLARGDIIWALSPNARNQTEFEFEVKVDQRMAPEGRIMCFYIREQNKELIVDSVRVPVAGLMRNLAKVTTSREEAKPGQEVEVSVLTKPNAQVGILGIDQSVLLLRSGNDISQQEVDSDLQSYSTKRESFGERGYAKGIFDTADLVVITNTLIYDGPQFREGRLLYSGGAYGRTAFDSSSPKSGVVLNKLIQEEAILPPDFHINKPKAAPLVIRSFFPETWLWENATANQEGTVSFKSKIPDTITSWMLSAFSISEPYGLGLSSGKTSVRVFRPFFIKLNLPYSIIRGETISIQAVVFNYSKRPTSAKVMLDNSKGDFEFVEAANELGDERRTSKESESRLIRIPAEDGASVSFLVRPKRAGQLDVKVTAQGEFAGDGVVRKLLVKPEGQIQHLNKAYFVQLKDSRSTWTKNVSIQVPNNAVADSQRVSVTAVGDVLGPGLANVDDLLRLPYGCGEQNMVNLVPNIAILNYLQRSKRLREQQRSRAVRNIESGYQRQLKYKRTDGSFSAFGQSDTNGSVWLTAYVLKTFQQARSIITVDESVIRRAANFIARFSRSDGSIEEVGMLHNKELQSLASSSSTYLTAYALIALLQKPIEPDNEAPAPVAIDEVTERGLNYLEQQLDYVSGQESPYELAIITYALHLANRKSKDLAYEKLWSRVTANDLSDMNWWEHKTRSEPPTSNPESEDIVEATATTSPSPPPLKPIKVNDKHSAHLFVPDSLSIETTSWALLSTVHRGELNLATPVVKWLISQQNSNGGFSSTQDTVLAIEALAAFAGLSFNSKKPLSIDLELLYPRVGRQKSDLRKNGIDQMLISQPNALVNQQIRLPDNITWLHIQASGEGSAVIQVAWQYNLLVSAEKPAFYLNPILDKTSNANYLQLSICTFYKAGDASNMAVIEVELPSGYVTDVEALPSLRRSKDIKRIDTADGDTKVFIYVDKVTRDELCLTVPAHRTSKVSNNKPVPVTIYDYYNRQQTARIFYEPEQASSCDICDQDTCSESCSKKPKKSDRLVSLHEQRKIHNGTIQSTTNISNRRANLVQIDSPSVTSASNSSYQILPLAPVLAGLVSVARNLYRQ